MLPSSLVLLISTVIQQIDAAPLKHQETVLEAEVTNKPWGPGSGAGSWQNAWPYIPAWWSTAGDEPSPGPHGPPAYTVWNTPPPAYPTPTQYFTSWTGETYTDASTVYSTFTAPTSIVTIEPSPSITEPTTSVPFTPAPTTSTISTSIEATTAPESTSILPTTFSVPSTSIAEPTNIPTPLSTPLPSTFISTATLISSSTLVSTSTLITTSTSELPPPATTSPTRRRKHRPHKKSSQTTESLPTTFPFPSTSVLSIPSTAVPTIPITEISSSIVIIPSPSETTLSVSSSIVVVPTVTPTSAPAPGGQQLSVTINNSLGSNAHAYLTGVDSNGALVMLTTDGTFYTPTASSGNPEEITANVALSLNPGANQFTIPGYISSARIWFSQGTLQFSAVSTSYGVGLVEPTVTNVNDASTSTQWAFVELTWIVNYGLFANLSFVDFVGIGVGMSLTTTDGGSQSAPGMPGDGAEVVCAALKAQAATDGQPWDQLCEYDSNGGLTRVLSPGSYLSINSNAFAGYFDDYVSQVWSKYSSEPLYIDSQNSLGQISCQVSGDTLNCNGDNRGYAQPTSQDIFSCSTGPFAILDSDNDVHRAVVPRLCAAFNRATLLIPNGNVQPKVLPNRYYGSTPNNVYSKYVHTAEINHAGYAFPYDDVAPSEQYDVAGIVAAPNPAVLTVNLGG